MFKECAQGPHVATWDEYVILALAPRARRPEHEVRWLAVGCQGPGRVSRSVICAACAVARA